MNNTTVINTTIINTTAVTYATQNSVKLVIIPVYSFLSVICIFTNSLVCYVIATRKTTDGPLKYYVLSLSITDIFVGAVCIPLFLTKEFIIHWKWALHDSFSTAFDIFLCTCSIEHLVIMAVDRVLLATKPILYHTKLRHRKPALRMLLIPWVSGVIFASIPYTGGGTKQFEYYATMGLIAFIPFPCALIAACYVKLYVTVKRRNDAMRKGNNTDRSVDQSHMMKMILFMVVAFTVCWIPLVIYYSIYEKHYLSPNKHLAFHYCAKFLSYSNSVWNSIIYALLNPIFRNGLRDLLKSCCHSNI